MISKSTSKLLVMTESYRARLYFPTAEKGQSLGFAQRLGVLSDFEVVVTGCLLLQPHLRDGRLP